MGLCESQVLQKTSRINNIMYQDPSKRTARKEPVDNNTARTSHLETNEIDLKETENVGEINRPYFSFTSFMLQNEKPQVFEWHFLQEIGKGTLSQIYLCQNVETEVVCVAKVYNNAILHRQTFGDEEPPFECLEKEISIMSNIAHPNVLSFHEKVDDVQTNSTILILPFAVNGTLPHFLSTLEGNKIPYIMVCMFQIGEGLSCMHELNVIHHDIQPQHIYVYSDMYYTIGSFHYSIRLPSDDDLWTRAGRISTFSAPEELEEQPSYHLKQADMWSYGVTFYWALYQKMPFKLDQPPDEEDRDSLANFMKQAIAENPLEFPENPDIPNGVTDLIKALLDTNPEKRPSWADARNSDFFARAREIQESLLVTNTITEDNVSSNFHQ